MRHDSLSREGRWCGCPHLEKRFGADGLVTAKEGSPAALIVLAIVSSLMSFGSLPMTAQNHATPSPRAHADQHPGYLGVSLLDLDPDAVGRLHLKDAHGALIVTIDREAPAASAGLHARDVIVEMSGQRIDNVEALRRKLRESSSGSTISLRISRDGSEQLISVQLGDEAAIARAAWDRHFSAPGASNGQESVEPPTAAAPAIEFVAPRGTGPGAGFLGRFSSNASYTGLEIDPLSTQLADFFGVHDGAGLLVRSVNTNSPAATAGLKAGDVILRVNNQLVVTREDWTKQLHANRGQAVQLSVMRNRHEQTMAMIAGASKKH